MAKNHKKLNSISRNFCKTSQFSSSDPELFDFKLNYLSHYFDKNFVKATCWLNKEVTKAKAQCTVVITEIYSHTFLTKISWKKLINSWFDEIFYLYVKSIHVHEILFYWRNISRNQLFRSFCCKIIAFTKFLSKNCGGS